MDAEQVESVLRNLDRRVDRIEQILPTLATKEEVREEGERTRRHFDVVAEDLVGHIKVIAEGHAALTASHDELRAEVRAGFAAVDQRITALAAQRVSRRRG